MRVFCGAATLFAAAVFVTVGTADEKSEAKPGGAFNVKAFTGDQKGKTLCYVWKYNGEKRPAVVVIFTSKADENLASLVKAVDAVQKNNEKLGTVVVGVSGVAGADLEKLQDVHKLTTPLTVGVDEDGPPKWKLNKDAAVNIVVYKAGGGLVKAFAFKDTKAAAAKASEIAASAETALKGGDAKKETKKKKDTN